MAIESSRIEFRSFRHISDADVQETESYVVYRWRKIDILAGFLEVRLCQYCDQFIIIDERNRAILHRQPACEKGLKTLVQSDMLPNVVMTLILTPDGIKPDDNSKTKG